VLHLRTEEYARGKVCNGLAGEVRLSEMQQLKAVFRESEARVAERGAERSRGEAEGWPR